MLSYNDSLVTGSLNVLDRKAPKVITYGEFIEYYNSSRFAESY
mgnify:CR=1 FL=1